MNCQAAHSNWIPPEINLILFLSTDHEMAQRNGDHLMENCESNSLASSPGIQWGYYSWKKKIIPHNSLKMCFHLYCPVNILYDRKTLVTWETSLLWMEDLSILQNRKKQLLHAGDVWSDLFFCVQRIDALQRLAKILVIWRWALPTKSACSTIDRHNTSTLWL